MDVIESLKQKTEENEELIEESSEEDGLEEISDPVPGTSKSSSEHSDGPGSTDVSLEPPIECELEMAHKRIKVENEVCLSKTNAGEEDQVTRETPVALDLDSEAGITQAAIDKGGNKEMQGEEADSPSSPLHMPSDGQDSA